MALLLGKKFSSRGPCFPSTAHTIFLKLSISAIQVPPTQSSFIVDYLINSCGLSPEKALKTSKNLTHIKSPLKPDSVRHFLKHNGFSESQIVSFICKRPELLCAQVNRLKPRLMALQELGLSEADIAQFVSNNPSVLQVCDLRPNIEYLMKLLGSKEKFLKVVKREPFIVFFSLEKRIIPNVFFLQKCGIPHDGIVNLLIYSPYFFTKRQGFLEETVKRAEELGLLSGSRMLWRAIRSAGAISRTAYDAKIKLLKELGWSDVEVASAVRSCPQLVWNSERKMRNNMDFLLNVVGCEPSYVARFPVLLSMSLEKRLIPRHNLWKILKARSLHGGDYGLKSIMSYPEKKFMTDFVLQNEKEAPELLEVYTA